MSVIESSGYCAHCDRVTLHHKQRINNVLHLLLTICTGGLWLIVWLLLGGANSAKRMRCTSCGRKPGVAEVKHLAGRELAPFRGSQATATRGADPDEVPPSTWLPPEARPPRD